MAPGVVLVALRLPHCSSRLYRCMYLWLRVLAHAQAHRPALCTSVHDRVSSRYPVCVCSWVFKAVCSFSVGYDIWDLTYASIGRIPRFGQNALQTCASSCHLLLSRRLRCAASFPIAPPCSCETPALSPSPRMCVINAARTIYCIACASHRFCTALVLHFCCIVQLV